MFDRVIPSLKEINNSNTPLTTGESFLVEFLDSVLARDDVFNSQNSLVKYDGWLIFPQPFLNGSRPDIVILNPKVGIQIIEVKDWNLSHYNYIKDHNDNLKFCVSDRDGTYSIKSPVKQVEHYKGKILGQLVPEIGERVNSNKINYGLIKTSIYFHNANTIDAQQLFSTQIKNFEVFPVFGRDKLDKSNLKNIVPDSIRTSSNLWSEKWNKRILFWLNPPFHNKEQGKPLYLNSYQQKFADPSSGHHRIRGVAGSGKTQVLAYRAAKLASEGKNVLILSFNITLWHYIRDMVNRIHFDFEWKKIVFNHFHGFCKDILNDFGVEWPNEGDKESIFREIVPNKVIDAIKNRGYDKYDAILIDEGQDYYLEWYTMLNKFLTSRDELVVVCDKKQNIYNREMEWLDKRRKGVEKFGDWIELRTILRLPERIANVCNSFSEVFNLNQDVKVENIENTNLFDTLKEHLLWWNIDNQWLAKIENAFDLLQDKINAHPSDIVILLPNKNYGFECIKKFNNRKIEVNHIFDENDSYKSHKKSFWMGDSRLKICTIHSFKGWEMHNVILLIPPDDKQENIDMLIYTALTRTKKNIIIINMSDRYKAFGNDLDVDWID